MRKGRRKPTDYKTVKVPVKCDCPLDTLIRQGPNYKGLMIYWCKKHHTSRVE